MQAAKRDPAETARGMGLARLLLLSAPFVALLCALPWIFAAPTPPPTPVVVEVLVTEGGVPFVGGEVIAVPRRQNGYSLTSIQGSTGGPLEQLATDQRGIVQIELDRPREYRLHVKIEDDFGRRKSIDLADPAINPAHVTVDIFDVPPRTLKGSIVRHDTGEPIVGARVFIRFREEERRTASAADGSFELELPQRRSLFVIFEADGMSPAGLTVDARDPLPLAAVALNEAAHLRVETRELHGLGVEVIATGDWSHLQQTPGLAAGGTLRLDNSEWESRGTFDGNNVCEMTIPANVEVALSLMAGSQSRNLRRVLVPPGGTKVVRANW